MLKKGWYRGAVKRTFLNGQRIKNNARQFVLNYRNKNAKFNDGSDFLLSQINNVGLRNNNRKN